MSRTLKFFALTLVAGLGLMMTNPAHADTSIIRFNNGNIKVIATEINCPPRVVYYGPARGYAYYRPHFRPAPQIAWRAPRFDPRFNHRPDFARYDAPHGHWDRGVWIVARD